MWWEHFWKIMFYCALLCCISLVIMVWLILIEMHNQKTWLLNHFKNESSHFRSKLFIYSSAIGLDIMKKWHSVRFLTPWNICQVYKRADVIMTCSSGLSLIMGWISVWFHFTYYSYKDITGGHKILMTTNIKENVDWKYHRRADVGVTASGESVAGLWCDGNNVA